MQVFSIFANNKLRNYQYIIQSLTNIVIDPYNGEQIIDFAANKLKSNSIDILLNTHQHYDHIKGNDDILSNGATLKANENLCLEISEKQKLVSLYTPGHTMDSYSYLLFDKDGDKVIGAFTGDTLFHLGVGNCKNGGDPQALAETIVSLDNILDRETRLYIGHDYLENNYAFAKKYFEIEPGQNDLSEDDYLLWGEQKRVNPFLRVLFEPSFRKKYYADLTPIEAFIKMRGLRDNF